MTIVFKRKLDRKREELSLSIVLLLAAAYRMLGMCPNMKVVLSLLFKHSCLTLLDRQLK